MANITGTLLNDVLNGTIGNDVINALNGDDIIRASAGSDSINGGDGNDILIGGLGRDILAGGAGSDIFRYNSALEGGDIINDLKASQGDKIELSASGFGGGLVVGQLQRSQLTLGSAFTNPNQRFRFDTSSSIVFFDKDGSSSQFGSVEIAKINGVNGPQIIEVIA